MGNGQLLQRSLFKKSTLEHISFRECLANILTNLQFKVERYKLQKRWLKLRRHKVLGE